MSRKDKTLKPVKRPVKRRVEHASTVVLSGMEFCIEQTSDNAVRLSWPGAGVQLPPMEMTVLAIGLLEAARLVAQKKRPARFKADETGRAV